MILLPLLTCQYDFQLMIPTSLYIHIPWCIQKCPYCDFNSHKSPEILPEKAYTQALIADFSLDFSQFSKPVIDTLFIGGGTPSVFSAAAYHELFSELQKTVRFADSIEITLEANPGTVDFARFADYFQCGINRLSLGIQSFNANHLKKLGRIHDDKQAHQAIDAARKAGFKNINLDIMHSLPGQTLAEGLEDIKQALLHQPEHISWYQLTLEPNTVFYKFPPILPDDDHSAELESRGFALLQQYDFHRYEISAFCKPNHPSRHNLNYWLFGDYYGIGAGAHGKITTEEGQIFRTNKQRQPSVYLNPEKSFTAATEIISPDNLIFEFMLNTSRLEQAIPNQLFNERTGLPFRMLEPMLQHAEKKNLIARRGETWQITPQGRLFTNDLQALFLPN